MLASTSRSVSLFMPDEAPKNACDAAEQQLFLPMAQSFLIL
jgi:hypothetical protein